MSARQRRRTIPVSGKAVMIGALLILLLVGAGVYAAVHLLHRGAGPDRTAQYGAVQEFVKAKFGGATYFTPLEETSFQPTEDGKLRVTGEVDVVSPGGPSTRYAYTVVMHQGPDGDWQADEVSLVPV